MGNAISSVKGYWRATTDATVRAAGLPTPVPMSATSNQNDWGSSIYAKSSEKSTTSHPWAEVDVPDNPALASKAADVHIDMDLEYPQVTGSSSFTTHRAKISNDFPLQLAPAHAGAQYDALWWESTLLGVALVVICGIVLVRGARRLQARALPTRILNA